MGKSMIEERKSTDAEGKPYTLKIDNTPVRVRYLNNGVESVQKRYIAEEEQRRGKVKILGEARSETREVSESESATEAREKREQKIEQLKKDLQAEESKSSPNENAVRALKNQIEKLEK